MEVDGVKTWVVLARYQSFSSCGEKDGIIRVDDFKQACVMQSDGKVGSKGMYICATCNWKLKNRGEMLVHYSLFFFVADTAYMYYYDNPKGMLPTWLINWAAKVKRQMWHCCGR